MSLEAKEAHRETSKFAIQMRRKLETKEQTALAKDKHREKQKLKMRKTRQAETDKQSHLHREIKQLAMKRTCEAETEEESHLHMEINKLAKKRKQEAETEEESHLHREINKLAKKRKREAETDEEKKMSEAKNKLAKTRYRQAEKEHCHSKTEENEDDMEDVISRSKKEALKFLHRTKDPKNPDKHRAIVCIMCDRCIIGTEAIYKLMKAQISLHKKRLSSDLTCMDGSYWRTFHQELTSHHSGTDFIA